jgi:predicted amidohydrolase YtcJ
VCSSDLLKVDPMVIRDIKVQETIKDGKTVYKKL